jgi:hypothetical protein
MGLVEQQLRNGDRDLFGTTVLDDGIGFRTQNVIDNSLTDDLREKVVHNDPLVVPTR